MPPDEKSDEAHLLEHHTSIAKSPSRTDNSFAGFELGVVGPALLGDHHGSRRSSNPPSHHSLGWEEDVERDGKYNGSTSSVRSRTSTLKPAVTETYGKFRLFVTRSGTSKISYESADPNRSNTNRKYSGWRGGCLAAATAAGTILFMNLIFMIWALAYSKSGEHIGTIYEADCHTVKLSDSWLHIAINVLGTILLSASNYTIQSISAPTRKEIDAAHSAGKYLDIGLPSLRNLNGWRKKTLFALLVSSTLPLHFLWNSAVFTTTQELDYNVYVVTPSFFNLSVVDCSQNVSVTSGWDGGTSRATYYSVNPLNPLNYLTFPENTWLNSDDSFYQNASCTTGNKLLTNATSGYLQRLSNEECLNAYGPGSSLMSKHASLLVVTKEQPANSNATMLLEFKYQSYVTNYTGNSWVCDPEYLVANDYKCNYKDLAANASSWSLGTFTTSNADPWHIFPEQQYEIDYCLSQPTDLGGTCKLQYSSIIMVCVVIANTIKFCCIVFLLRTQFEPVLATIGDGIASFLERPDTMTEGRPFLDRKAARNFRKAGKPVPVRWQNPKHALRWWHAPSRARWIITLTLCTIAICAVSALLANGNRTVMADGLNISSPYQLGFGTYNSVAILQIFDWGGSPNLTAATFSSNSVLIAMVAVANLPQVIVSCLYFAYNTVYTSMVSADEWSRFTVQRKALRTTDPRGEQRSTYWLSLPWIYALPLAMASSVLHWLISQSLFIARTEVLDTNGNPEAISYMEVGYSALAILIALLFGCAMVLAMILNGSRKLKPCVLVGNNSLAIAAACQRPEKDDGAEFKKVKWGAVRHEGAEGEPGHCCFTSEEVERPRLGGFYI